MTYGSPNTAAESRNADMFTFLGLLRDLRARAQVLLKITQALDQQITVVSTLGLPDSVISAAISKNSLSIESTSEAIVKIFERLHSLLEDRGELYAEEGDEIAKLDAYWLRADSDLKALGAAGKDDRSRLLTSIGEALDSAIYGCTRITIPQRILKHLAKMPIGSVIHFREAYEDEFSSAEQRARLLRYLDLYPGAFETGLVDAANERIIRISPKGWRRNLTIWVTGAIALLGFLVIFFACHLGQIFEAPNWPFDSNSCSGFMSSYFFILVGTVSHILVTLLKQDRSASESNQSLATWAIRIHVRETSFYLSAMSLWLAPFISAFIPGLKGMSWTLAFFLGYSYDSFIDLFLQRFEKIVTSGTDAVANAFSAKADK